MQFTDVIHEGNLTAVKALLAEQPELLKSADEQGNTLLHYAVARHEPELIDFLIDRGALVTAENRRGETAAQWYEEFIASIYGFEQVELKNIRQAIAENDEQFITNYLKAGVSLSLRFPKGETILHLAVELQKAAIVKLILKKASKENSQQLLSLENSRGLTPLGLVNTSQEINKYLEERRTAANVLSIIQPLPPQRSFSLDKKFIDDVILFSGKLKSQITLADFQQLNPLRQVTCELAYITCRQALSNLTIVDKTPLLKNMLTTLFGSWSKKATTDFQSKLLDMTCYLQDLIEHPQQLEEVIHFTDGSDCPDTPYAGYYFDYENKIFLNITIENDLILLIKTLIHEVSHANCKSYDFVDPDCLSDPEFCVFDFKNAIELTSTGKSGTLAYNTLMLKPGLEKPLEIGQRLRKDCSNSYAPKKLNHWMVYNDAETQAVATMGLAALPDNYGQFHRKEKVLFIEPEFLSVEYLRKHPVPRKIPNHSKGNRKCSTDIVTLLKNKKSTRNSALQKEAVANSCTPRSNFSGSSGECSTTASRKLSSCMQLLQAMTAQSSSSASPDLPNSDSNDSSWDTISGTPSPPPSPSNLKKPRLFHTSAEDSLGLSASGDHSPF